jgi:phospholipid-translocating ATPase
MLDGIYQSAICFFMGYLLFAPATPLTENGRGVEDRERMGVYIACVTVAVVNSYILLNTYRWDWLMVLVTAISILLIWTWTGIYSSFTGSFQFYKAASEVYGTLNFWALSLIILFICLLPRFSLKFAHKYFRPMDVDIIREQVKQGKFGYLDQFEAYVPPSATVNAISAGNAEVATDLSPSRSRKPASLPDSQRPIYPPSEAPTAATQNPRSQTGSDQTDKTRPSTDLPPIPNQDKAPLERMRSSFERHRPSLDRLRPSYEGSRDFTSAALLTRIESSHSASRTPVTPASKRRLDITSELS